MKKGNSNNNKYAKKQVIDFAKSLVNNNSFSPNINSTFIDLLIETSLAASFYQIHKEQTDGKFKNILEKIHKGVKAQNEYNTNTLNTLNKSNLKYYLLKDSAEPWENRYSCDIDIFVGKEDITKLKLFLKKEGYLLDGKEIVHPKELRKKLFKLNTNQTDLLNLQQDTKEYYLLSKEKEKSRIKPISKNTVLKNIENLRKIEKDYLFNLLKINKFIYGIFDSKRDIKRIKRLLKMNSRIHFLCTINLNVFPRTDKIYYNYHNTLIKAQKTFEEYGAHIDVQAQEEKRISLNYRKECEFIDIKTKINVLGMASENDLLFVGNKLAPVDNLILNASHFVGNIRFTKSGNSYQGFLKYLIDGAILLRSNEISQTLLIARAKKFKKTKRLKYYLYLLNKTGLINHEYHLPNSLWFQLYKMIPINRLLFNQNSVYINIIKFFIRTNSRKLKIYRSLKHLTLTT